MIKKVRLKKLAVENRYNEISRYILGVDEMGRWYVQNHSLKQY